MTVRSTLRVASAAALAAGLVSIASASQAVAACKGHSHSATGSPSGIQYLASVSAKNAWKSVVSAHDGTAWDSWYKASGKSVGCKKSGQGAAWVCTAKAKPCN